MRKFTQLMLTLALLVVGVGGVKATKQSLSLPNAWGGVVVTNEGKTYSFEANWTGASTDLYGDLSGYDYVWIKYSGLTGEIRIGVEYDEWIKKEDWGDVFYADEVYFSDASGIVGIPIEKVKTFVKGSAETDGAHIGEIYAKHVRKIVLQNPVNPSTITIDEICVGTTADYYAAQGYDKSKNHVLRVTNSSAKPEIYGNSVTYTFAAPLTEGTKYTVTAKICAADVTRGSVMKFVLSGGVAKYGDEKAILANTFTQVSQEFTAGSNTGLEIDLGYINGNVYIDDVSVVAEGSSTNLVSNADFEVPFSTAGWTVPGHTEQTIGHSEREQGEISLGARKVTIGSTGWATMIAPDFAVSVPAGVEAYFAKYNSEKGNVKLSPVANMYQWGRAVVKGESGDYYFPWINSGDVTADGAWDGMDISWGVESDGTQYALGAIGGVVGFVKVKKGVTIPSGKPYLVIPSGSAREFIGFGEDETTGIENLTPALSEGEGTIYDLQGRRVAQPTKGLYIVNGKKVLVK